MVRDTEKNDGVTWIKEKKAPNRKCSQSEKEEMKKAKKRTGTLNHEEEEKQSEKQTRGSKA